MEYSPPPLFNQGPSARVRLVACVVASIILIVLDSRYSVMEVVRKVVGAGLYPIQQIATIPVTASRDAIDYVQRLGELQAENERLTKQSLIDQEKLHQLQTLRTHLVGKRSQTRPRGTARMK